ncbi:MAG: PAS domain S-box protein [Rubrivivax sp.]|nr:PAS domain S-box protein [Rubrivivax sp.]
MLLTLGSILLVTVGGMFISLGHDREESLATLKAVAELKAQELGDWMGERGIDAEMIALGSDARQLASNWQSLADPAALALLQARLPALLPPTRFGAASVFDARGEPAWRSDKAPEALPAHAAERQRAARLRKPSYLGPYADGAGVAHLDFLVPLAEPGTPEGRPVPLLALHLIGAQYLPERLRDWPMPSRTGEVVPVRRDGDDVVALTALRGAPDALRNLRQPVTQQQFIGVQLVTGGTTAPRTLDGFTFDGVPAFGAGLKVPGTDWFLLARMDRSELLQGSLRQSAWIALTGLLLMAVSASAMYLLRQRQQLALAEQVQGAQQDRLRALGLLNAIVEGSAEGVLATDLQGRPTLRNGALAALLGGEIPLPLQHALGSAVEGTRSEALELRWPGTGGERTLLADVAPLDNAAGVRMGAFAMLRDITGAKQAERALHRANRALAMARECSQAVAQAEAEAPMWASVCQIAGQTGGYRLAWIGLAEAEPSQRVAVAARAGAGAGYLDGLEFSRADDDMGRGPTGTALRERRVVMSRDIAGDPQLQAWRERAQAHGLASSVALPLLDDTGRAFGVLCLYAGEPHAFDDEELAVARGIAVDLAQGARALRDRRARAAAEATLRQRAQRSQLQLQLPQLADALDEPSFLEQALALVQSLTGSHSGCLRFADDATPAEGTLVVDVVDEGRVAMRIGLSGKASPYDDGDVDSVQLLGNEIWRLVQRRRSLDALRKLQQAVEQSANSIVITNLRAEIEYVNAAFESVTGYRREEVIGKNPRILHPDHVKPGERVEMWEALTRGRPWRGEFRNRRKDGSEYVELAHIAPLRQPDGSITHYVGVKEDITEKTRIAEELDRYRQRLEELVEERTAELAVAQRRAEAASQAKSAFLANMSHEIRTPMNAIVGLSYLLRQDRPTARQGAWLAKIDAAAMHLLSIINSILDLSKIEAGKLTLEGSDFAPATVLEEVAALITDSAQAKGLALHVETDGLPGWLHGDTTRLRQALLNYADNALKFTPAGAITLRARCEDRNEDGLLLRFEVLDTGIGIEPEALPRLFQAFEQADTSTTRRHGGTGLGLALTRQLATLMGGAAGAENRPGGGSLFWFTARLRVADTPPPQPPAPEAADAETALRRWCRGARVLLVEDEAVNREVALELLRDTGLVVVTANDGRQALDRLRQQPFDLVLMDLQMPVMDGYETTRRLRAEPTLARLPVLAMTASAFDNARQSCLDVGMNDFVPKPVEPRVLYSTLLRWLPRTQAPSPPPAPGPGPQAEALQARAHALLATLDGVDTERGLAALHGKALDYVRLLRLFGERHGGDPAQVAEALAAGRHEAARALLHQHVGAAGALGLVRLQTAAQRLQEALRQGGADAAADTLVRALQAHMQGLQASLATWPDLEPPGRPPRDAPAAVLLALEPLLEADDIDAVETFRPHRAAFEAHYGEAGARLARELEGFDFAAARQTVQALLRGRA